MIKKTFLKIVGYLRLSREDGYDESVSIANQRRIIQQYAQENGLFISDWYVDDGVSGYVFDRKDFNRLKHDLKYGDVDVVIVKDLSRIGRHNAKTLLFIEEITKLGKQIIIINDNFDNLKDDDGLLGIKTWYNELYIKDISKKIRSAISSMQNDGNWLSNIPYGYRRIYGKKKAFEVDPIMSLNVKRLFDMYVNGTGSYTIARIFTDEGIPTPTQAQNIHREELGLDPHKSEAKMWSAAIVRKILKNEFYIGTLVLNKTKTVGINGKKVFNNQDEFLKFPYHHEAIIDEQTFNLAKQIREERAATSYRGARKYINPLSGILYCAKCGKAMSPINKSQYERLYVCRTYHSHGIKYCDHNKVYEKDIMHALRVYLIQCREALHENILELDKMIKKELKKINGVDSVSSLEKLEERLDKVNKELKSLITQKTRESIKNPEMSEIIEDTYKEMINEKMIQIKGIKSQIEGHKEMAISTKDIETNLKTALDILDDIIISETMTKKQISILVEKIYVHYGKGLEIRMRGNLNEIIEPEAIITLNRELAYTKATVDRMYEAQEFYYKDIVANLRSTGYDYGYYRTFKPLADKMLELGLIEKGATHNSKFIFKATLEEAYDALQISTVVEPDPCVITNSVGLESLMLISRWIYQTFNSAKDGLTSIM